ncbi:MAG: hypothetical protein AAGA85_17845, partial [Bacteroidota bacterium]
MTNTGPKTKGVVVTCAFLILASLGIVLLNQQQATDEALPNNKQALLDNPFHTEGGPEYENVKQLPKHDRPDLALRQFMEMTADPKDHQTHPERAVEAFRQAQRIVSTQEYARNVDLLETTWEERGPTNVGGRTRALMFDPNDVTSKKVWAAGVSGGLWVTDNIDDANTPWVSIGDFWANLAITAMAYDPSNTQILYIGTGEGYFNINAVRGEGLWKSTDGGASWEQLPSTSNNPDFYTIHDLVVLDDGAILVSTMDNGVMRSLDGGATWNNVLNDGLANRAGDLEVASNGDIYASTGIFSPGNIWKSTDGGTTWSDILPDGYTVQRIDLAVALTDANVIYALMQGKEFGVSNAEGGGIIKSTDGGATWNWLPNPTVLDPNVKSEDFTNGQGWYNLIVQVDPNDADHVIIGGIDLYQSLDGGESWNQISKQNNAAVISHLDLPVVHADQHAIVFRPGLSDEAIFGNDGGVYLGTQLVEGHLGTGTTPQPGAGGDTGNGGTDADRDGDGLENEKDLDADNRNICGDSDGDGCDDCSSGVFNPLDDGIDSDGDGLCDSGDLDDDNDGVVDSNDTNPLNANICGDTDGDGCDDCSSGAFDPNNDGLDSDGDGLCNSGDTDDDNDGVADNDDINPLDAFICGDNDGDTCDDCANGSYDPMNDGADNDNDGLCDAGDPDDDNDGILDLDDKEPFIAYVAPDSAATEVSINDGSTDSTTTEPEQAMVDNSTDSTAVDSTQVAVNDEMPTDSTGTQQEEVIVGNTSDSTAVDSTQVAVNDQTPVDSTSTQGEQTVVDNPTDSTGAQASARIATNETESPESSESETAGSSMLSFSSFGISKNYNNASLRKSYLYDIYLQRAYSTTFDRENVGFSPSTGSKFSLFRNLFKKRSRGQGGFGMSPSRSALASRFGKWSQKFAVLEAPLSVAGPKRISLNDDVADVLDRIRLQVKASGEQSTFTSATSRPDSEGLGLHDGGIINQTQYEQNQGSDASKTSGTDMVIEPRNNNYNVTQFYAVTGMNEENSNYFLAGAQDNGTQKFTRPGKGSTTMVTGGDGTFTHIDQNESDIQISAHVFNYYFISTDGGATFSTMMADYTRGRFINPSDYDDEQNIFYGAGNSNEIVRVSNIRRGARDYISEVVSLDLNMEQISNIKASPYTSNRLFVGTGEGAIFIIDDANTTPQVLKISGSIDG